MRWAGGAPLLIPVLVGIFIVAAYGENAVWGDEWGIVGLLYDYERGELSPGDFFAQHNEHRMPLPKLLMFTLGRLSGYSSIALLSASQIMLGMVLALLFRASSGAWAPGDWGAACFLPAALLLYSPRQAVNMLWGFQTGFWMVLLFTVLALYMLRLYVDGRRWTHLTSACLVGAAASMSSANGLLVWPAGLLVLGLARRSAGVRISILVWAGAAVTVGLIYAYGYNYSAPSGGMAYALAHRAEAVVFFMTALGGPVYNVPEVAYAGAGALGLWALALAYTLGRGLAHEWSFWLALGAFSILSAMMITIGRLSYGPIYALSPRYTTFTVLLPVSLYVIYSGLTRDRVLRGASRTICLLISIGLGLLAFPSYVAGMREATALGYQWDILHHALRSYERLPEEALEILYPEADAVVELGAFMQGRGLNVFGKGGGPGRLLYAGGRFMVVDEGRLEGGGLLIEGVLATMAGGADAMTVGLVSGDGAVHMPDRVMPLGARVYLNGELYEIYEVAYEMGPTRSMPDIMGLRMVIVAPDGPQGGQGGL